MNAANPVAAAPVPMVFPAILKNFLRSTSSRANSWTTPPAGWPASLLGESLMLSPWSSPRTFARVQPSLRTPAAHGSPGLPPPAVIQTRFAVVPAVGTGSHPPRRNLLSEHITSAYASIDRSFAGASASTRRKFVAGAAGALGGLGLLTLPGKALAANDAQTILNI